MKFELPSLTSDEAVLRLSAAASGVAAAHHGLQPRQAHNAFWAPVSPGAGRLPSVLHMVGLRPSAPPAAWCFQLCLCALPAFPLPAHRPSSSPPGPCPPAPLPLQSTPFSEVTSRYMGLSSAGLSGVQLAVSAAEGSRRAALPTCLLLLSACLAALPYLRCLAPCLRAWPATHPGNPFSPRLNRNVAAGPPRSRCSRRRACCGWWRPPWTRTTPTAAPR